MLRGGPEWVVGGEHRPSISSSCGFMNYWGLLFDTGYLTFTVNFETLFEVLSFLGNKRYCSKLFSNCGENMTSKTKASSFFQLLATINFKTKKTLAHLALGISQWKFWGSETGKPKMEGSSQNLEVREIPKLLFTGVAGWREPPKWV